MSRCTWLPIAVFLLGAVLMVMGAIRGEMDTVFQKAIHICLECIGIG